MQGGELDGLGNGRHKYKLLVNCDSMMQRLMLKKVCTNRLLSLRPWIRRLIFLPGVPSWRKVPGVSRSFGSCTDAVHLNGVIVEKVDRCVVLHMERGENRVNREFVNVMNQAFDLAERYI